MQTGQMTGEQLQKLGIALPNKGRKLYWCKPGLSLVISGIDEIGPKAKRIYCVELRQTTYINQSPTLLHWTQRIEAQGGGIIEGRNYSMKTTDDFSWLECLKPTTLAAIVADFEEDKEGRIDFEVALAADRLLEDIVGATEADRLIVAANNL